MDRESVERLRFDRRLASRRGWVEESEVEQYLESLPDVAGKLTTVAELEAESSADERPAPAASASESFGGSSSFGGGGIGGSAGG